MMEKEIHPLVKIYLNQIARGGRFFLFENDNVSIFLGQFLDKILAKQDYLMKKGWIVTVMYDLDEKEGKLDLRLEASNYGIRWVFNRCVETRQAAHDLWENIQDLPTHACEFYLVWCRTKEFSP